MLYEITTGSPWPFGWGVAILLEDAMQSVPFRWLAQ